MEMKDKMEQEEDNRPKWLLELENRKRKPRLAHEVGAGAPCMKCSAACPGLDLHFWRKICKNCKCSRDDHDVPNDEFPQFDLLFGPSGKPNRKMIVLKINKKEPEDESTFEWAPPDTTKELAADYMKALPEEKLPIRGTAGAALRKQQLQRQLPLHDIDHKLCDELSEFERKEFEKYLENLKKYVGQGKVTKAMGARPFDRSLMTPANATDMNRFSPSHRASVTGNSQPEVSRGINLATPSSFLEKNFPSAPSQRVDEASNAMKDCSLEPIPGSCAARLERINSPATGNSSYENPLQARYHRVLANFRGDSEISNSLAVDVGQRNAAATPFAVSRKPEKEPAKNFPDSYDPSNSMKLEKSENSGQNREDENSLLAEKMLSEALLPPSSINSSHIIGSTLDEKGLSFIREKLASKYSGANNSANPQVEENRQVKSKRADQLGGRAGFDDEESAENSAKYAGQEVENSSGNCLAARMQENTPSGSGPSVERSGPIGNSSIKAELSCFGPTNSHLIKSENLNNPIFPESCLKIGENSAGVDRLRGAIEQLGNPGDNLAKLHNCHECRESIRLGDVVVSAEKAVDTYWHPGCFVCSVCNELLADLVYFYYKGKLYCGRDLATLLEIPRCFACDELIFVREYTVAEAHNYHVKHFCCWDCDVPLAGQRYISENDRPLCLPCYQRGYAKTCRTCEGLIAADQQGVAVKNLNFHANEQCFRCETCKKSLLNGKMAIKEDRPFCSKECITKFLSERTN